ncbi:ABC transporter ATP-binding protein [[Clostridium] fimetarium]|uniref:ATP-binding cassette, subfamily B/ATP-binding cassette, subfamily B, MsbA n=1 Tax=[Clostridium] fimetarium TaxID=99656 RepID=A0A1I0NJZ3_9FIRM|nr:ABC transporter ATP-binding protein [[Clostridium] fimetarium]SEW01498.1 ATP-binding cassette, subfamily B/ATP-binding cassette, subfamily B, MsbA [[Clostridium] fimetarium]
MKIILYNSHYLFVFTIMAYIMAKIVTISATMISNAIDDIHNMKNIDIHSLIIKTLILILISMIMAFVKQICSEKYSIKIQKQCKNFIASKIQRMEYGYFDNHSGSIITKLTSDMTVVEQLFSETIPTIIQSIVTIITVCIYILAINKKLLFGVVVCYPFVLLVTSIIAKKLVILAKRRRGKFDLLAETVGDCLSGIEIVRSYELLKTVEKRIDRVVEDILKNESSRNKYNSLSGTLQNLLRWIPNVICSVVALITTINGEITVGELMAFIVVLNRIITPMSELPFIINDSKESKVSLDRINEIMNYPEEESGDFHTSIEHSGANAIELKNLSFSYEDNKDRKILNHCNLTFEKGKTTAVVGTSGAGKTTLFKIICGFLKPIDGAYELYGHNFKQWNLMHARDQIANVSQNIFLFPETIAENVAYGKENVALGEIIKSCKMANIHDFIISLPEQYNTLVGERGAKLSGGERQRLSIARAVLKKAPILLLDEPTSALDIGTEKMIQEAIDHISLNSTVIIIAHRLSTIRNADKIVVLDNGQVAESGTHESLISQNGIYAGLYHSELENSD